MGEKIFLELIYQSMKESAQQVRRTLGRPSSRATRQQALRQVAMLKTAKEAVSEGLTFDVMYVNRQYQHQYAFLRKAGKLWISSLAQRHHLS